MQTLNNTDKITAFHITVEASGEKHALLTISRLELNAEIAEAIRCNPEVNLKIRQYETTKKEFLKDLQELTNATKKD